MSKPVTFGEPLDPLVLFLADAFVCLAPQHRSDRTLKPEDRMEPKEPKNADQQPLHERIDRVGPEPLLGIVWFRMRIERRKARAHILMTRRAGLNEICAIDRGFGVRRGQIMMRRMAICAGRSEFVVERGSLTVEGVAISRLLLLVALRAAIDHLKREIADRRRGTLMRYRLVAVDAHRGLWISGLKCHSMGACFPLGDYPRVALVAHL